MEKGKSGKRKQLAHKKKAALRLGGLEEEYELGAMDAYKHVGCCFYTGENCTEEKEN